MIQLRGPRRRDSSGQHAAHYRRRRLPKATYLILVAALLGGCASHLSNGQRWGANATLRPGWERVGRAALNAALDARTLVPAAAAGVLAIGDLDDKLADAAQRRTPIFGSRSTALSFSDAMRAALIAEMVVTGITAPSGSVDEDWWWAKLKGLSVEASALGVTAGATELLQDGVGRRRPDGSSDGFPSGHASSSFAAAALSSNNLAAHRWRWRISRPPAAWRGHASRARSTSRQMFSSAPPSATSSGCSSTTPSSAFPRGTRATGASCRRREARCSRLDGSTEVPGGEAGARGGRRWWQTAHPA